MRNVMYDVPSVEGVSACRVTKEVVEKKKDPVLTLDKKTKSEKNQEASA